MFIDWIQLPLHDSLQEALATETAIASDPTLQIDEFWILLEYFWILLDGPTGEASRQATINLA